MSKTVLVTGATGFIGRHTIPLLLGAGYEVHAVSSREKQDGLVHWHRADLLAAPLWKEIFRTVKPAYLLHLAWDTTPGVYLHTPKNLDWVAASLVLCRAFYENGGKRAVCAGTCFEYDLSVGVLHEESPCRPSSLYGESKLALGTLVNHFCLQENLSFAWGRVFYLYGPYENENRVVPYVIRSLLAGQEALCSDGIAKKDYLYVEDVARAFVHLLGVEQNGTFNIGSGNALSLREILQKAAELIGRPELLKLGARESRPEPPLIEADAEKLQHTGFSSMFDRVSSLNETIEWWKQQKLKHSWTR